MARAQMYVCAALASGSCPLAAADLNSLYESPTDGSAASHLVYYLVSVKFGTGPQRHNTVESNKSPGPNAAYAIPSTMGEQVCRTPCFYVPLLPLRFSVVRVRTRLRT